MALDMGGIVATYTFKNDHKFLLQFRGIPTNRGPVEAQTEGTWSLAGNQLTLHNTASNSYLSVVGEDELATVDSITPDALVLSHFDRKNKVEQLTFRHVL